MQSEHIATIRAALPLARKYINATEPTFDAERVAKINRIDAALAALDKLAAATGAPPLDVPRYSHRNGETEPPTVRGAYFCRGTVETTEVRRQLAELLLMAKLDNGSMLVRLPDDDGFATTGNNETVWPAGKWDCQWWGPVTLPWDERPQVTLDVPDGLLVNEYQLDTYMESPVTLRRQPQHPQGKVPDKWAIYRSGSVLSKEGYFTYEPLPSSRDDEFISLCRFDTKEEALAAWREFVANADERPQEAT